MHKNNKERKTMKKIKILLYGTLALNLLLNITWGNEDSQPSDSDFIKVDIQPIKFSFELLDREKRDDTGCDKDTNGIIDIKYSYDIHQLLYITPYFNEEHCELYNEIFADQSKYFRGNYAFYENTHLIKKETFTFPHTLINFKNNQCNNNSMKVFRWEFDDVKHEAEYDLVIEFWVHKSLSGMRINIEDMYGACGFNTVYTVGTGDSNE